LQIALLAANDILLKYFLVVVEHKTRDYILERCNAKKQIIAYVDHFFTFNSE